MADPMKVLTGSGLQHFLERFAPRLVPTEGTTGQVLAKKSNSNFDTEWVDPAGGGAGGKAFSAYTWQEIITICQSGEIPSNWKIGDYKMLHISPYTNADAELWFKQSSPMGYDVPVYIGAFNHDRYYVQAPGHGDPVDAGTAPITFVIGALDILQYMKQGSSATTYNLSYMNQHVLHGLYQSIANNRNGDGLLVANAMHNMLISVRKKANGGNSDTETVDIVENMWIPSEAEVRGYPWNSCEQDTQLGLFATTLWPVTGTIWTRSLNRYGGVNPRFIVADDPLTSYSSGTIGNNEETHLVVACFCF